MNAGRTLRTLTCCAHGRYVVYVHGASAPSDREWEQVLALYQRIEHLGPRVLVLTLGAAPNAGQRARLHEVQRGYRPRMALLTSSRVARAAGVAYSWFNPEIRILGHAQLDAALAHLAATPAEAVELRAIVERLVGELGLGREVEAARA